MRGGKFFSDFFQRLKQYDDDEKKRIARNAELSLLSRRLEEKNAALTKENADLVSRACSCGFAHFYCLFSSANGARRGEDDERATGDKM